MPYANLTNPQTLNLYAMVSDNPETFADLDGHGVAPAVCGAGGIACKNETISSTINNAADNHPIITQIILGVVITVGTEGIGDIIDAAAGGGELIEASSATTTDAASAGTSTEGGASATGRLPQDVSVNPKAPDPLPTDRPVSNSPTQNNAAQSEVARMKQEGYQDIRVNQQQVNAARERVGVGRPDVQGTSPGGVREYHEFDRSTSTRGAGHAARAMANDPSGKVFLHTVD